MAAEIETQHLNAYFGDIHAVKGVDLRISSNRITAIIGPSGCGKSTLIRCMNRMHEVVRGARVDGKVLVDGEDIYGAGHGPSHHKEEGGDGVPEAEPVPDDVHLRQRRGRPAAQRCAGLEETG